MARAPAQRQQQIGQTPRPALRLGVFQGRDDGGAGRLVEERLLVDPDVVSVGTHATCTLILTEPRLGRSWRLLRVRRGRLQLDLAPWMSARWVAAGGVVDSPTQDGEGRRVVLLPGSSRGRIVMGDTTVLFQQITLSPHPLPRLPPSVRNGIWQRLDRVFALVVLIALVLHAGFVAYLRSFDWPRVADWQRQPERITTMVMPTPALPRPTAAGRPPAPHARAVPARRGLERMRPTRRHPPAAATGEEIRARLVARAARLGLPAVLGAADDEGPLADFLGAGAVDRDQEEALRDLGGLRASVGNLRPAIVDASRAPVGRIADVSALRMDDTAIEVVQVDGTSGERRVRSTVIAEPPAADDPALPPGYLGKEIRHKLGAIKACYERALKSKPQLAGKMILQLTVAQAGTVTAVHVDDLSVGDRAMAACIESLAVRWRFTPLSTGPALLSFPLVFQAAS